VQFTARISDSKLPTNWVSENQVVMLGIFLGWVLVHMQGSPEIADGKNKKVSRYFWRKLPKKV